MNRWLFNTHDPNDSTQLHTWFETQYDAQGLAWSHAWFLPNSDTRIIEQNRLWLKDRIIGEPQVPPGSDVTIEQLKAMGLVGVYE